MAAPARRWTWRRAGARWSPDAASSAWLALLLVLVVAGCRPAPPSPPPAEARAAPAERKVDSVLLDLLLSYQLDGLAGAEAYARGRGLLTLDDQVRLTLVLNTSDVQPVADQVARMGAEVVGTWRHYVDARVPLATLLGYANAQSGADFLRELSALSGVRDVQETVDLAAQGPTRDCAVQTARLGSDRRESTEGAERIGATAWHRAGHTGRGVRVGIVDGGFAGYRELLGTRLPSSVQTRAFTPDRVFGDAPPATRHGTAVAEVVHAVAPDAELYLAHIAGGVSSLASALTWLVDEVGVSVISMSVGYLGVSASDDTGDLALLADAVRASDVLLVAAAGNEAQEYYSAPSNMRNGFHEFAPGRDRLEIRPFDRSIRLVLNWYDWVQRDTDFHLLLLDRNNDVVASSRNQGPDKEPFQQIRFMQAEEDQPYYVRIRQVNGSRPVQLRLWVDGADMEQTTPATSIGTPADTRGAFAVGATYWRDDQVLCYSSRGPTPDNRVKPDISAPSHVSTASFRDSRAGFNGSSAATPHVAGAAALLRGANPSARVDQIVAYLEREARRLEPNAPTNSSGYGRLQLGDPSRATSLPAAEPRGTADSFVDRFAQAGSGLPNADEGRYGDGRYRLEPRETGRMAWSVYDAAYTSFVAELRGARAEGVTRDTTTATGRVMYGLTFWHGAGQGYHVFNVSTDGFWTLAQWVDGGWEILVPWTASAAVRRGNEPNDLQVEVDGRSVTLSINGQQVWNGQLRFIARGRVGLNATRFDGAGGASFGELHVTRR